jgi:hypothetical protein
VDLARARYLVSPEGREAFAAVRNADLPGDVVQQSTYLRKRYPPDQAAALGEQLALHDRAADRFGELAPPFLYTDTGLQMMTHPLVAARRAARFAYAKLPAIDATCGLGGDLGAMVDADIAAAGIERDPATAVLAGANVGRANVIRGDAAALPALPAGRALFLDPSRRDERSRRFDPAAFSPGWDTCLELARAASLACLKTAPGIADAAIPPEAEIEFVQVRRSLREAAIWFGGDARSGLRRAVMLPGTFEMTSDESEADPAPVLPGRYILDPASCVTRAGLVRQLAARAGGRLMDEQIAYLTLDRPAVTPFGTTFEVIEELPFSVGKLRDLLHSRGWRPDEIRRRGFPVEPDELRRLLRPRGSDPVALLCTTIGGARRVFVCRTLEVDGTAGQ